MGSTMTLTDPLFVAAIMLVAGAGGYVIAHDPGPTETVVCQEVTRTPHPSQPGVFAVTLLCSVNMADKVDVAPPRENLS